MKKVNLFCLLMFILIFLSFSSNLFGQVIPHQVTPSNMGNIAGLIETHLGEFINVSETTIFEHLAEPFVSQPPNQNCSNPSASIVGSNNNTITISVPGSLTALKYRFSYLNLETSAEAVIEKNPSTNNEYTLLGVPEGIYLFTIQEICTDGGSLTWIIIEDKFLENVVPVVPDDGIPCSCDEDETFDRINVSNGGGGISPSGQPQWPYISLGQKFDVAIEYIPQEGWANISGRRTLGLNGIDEIRLNLTCNQNLVFEGIQTDNDAFLLLMETVGSTEQIHGYFRTNYPEFKSNIHDELDLIFTYCVGINGSGLNSGGRTMNRISSSQLGIFPNPVNHTLNLSIEKFGNSNSLEIFFQDAAGTIVKKTNRKISEKNAVPVESFDVQNLSPGLYYCILKSDEAYKTIPFIKK